MRYLCDTCICYRFTN